MKTLSITIILLLGSLYVYPQNTLSKAIGKSTNMIALIPENLWLNIEAESINTNNSMPNRISMNVTVPKQTQGATFGEKVNQGLQKKEINTDSKELFPVSLTRQMVKVAPQTYKVEGTIQIEGKTYSISSVLKTKHDTVKNSINNVR